MPISFPSKLCALAGEAVSLLPPGAQVELLLRAGVRVILLRSERDDAALQPELLALVEQCRAKRATLLLHERLARSRAARPHGVLLDGDPSRVASARGDLGPEFIIGLTVRSAAEFQAAQGSGADFLLLEPIFPSANAPSQPSAFGVSGLNRLAARSAIPLASHGAISRDTLPIVLAAGAGMAVVSDAIWKEKNPEAAARALLKLAGEGLALPLMQGA